MTNPPRLPYAANRGSESWDIKVECVLNEVIYVNDENWLLLIREDKKWSSSYLTQLFNPDWGRGQSDPRETNKTKNLVSRNQKSYISAVFDITHRDQVQRWQTHSDHDTDLSRAIE